MLSDIWIYFRRLIFKVFKVFTKNEIPGDDSNMLSINVRVGPSVFVPLDVDQSWTIGRVKEILGPKVKLLPSEIRVIFAGHELSDDTRVEECDMGQQSVIHIVKGISAPSSSKNQSSGQRQYQELSRPSLSTVLQRQDVDADVRMASCTDDMKRIHFFVYCTAPCKRVCHGKLRVRCSTCKMTTLTVQRDPCCWDDVLVAGRIDGVCLGENCNGKVAEFFFKCANHLSSEDDSCVALYLIRANVRELPCLACMEISNPVLIFPCASGHMLCLGCFQEYCISRLNERRFVQDAEFGYTLPCPVNCEDSLIRETHHFKLLGGEHYDRYQRFGAEECLLQSGGVLCPQPGCGAGLIPDPECRRIVCVKGGQGCGFVFCRDCLQGYHIGDCIETELNVQNPSQSDTFCTERVQWDEASKVTIKVITKPCPKCRTPTERDGGCMHMVCGRPNCNFHWCWVCQQEWTRDCMGNHWFG